MTINRRNALRLWDERYDGAPYAEDFHGNLMRRDWYGKGNKYYVEDGKRIYCGWNIHHILPKSKGGTNELKNLICVNIYTNEAAADKTTYWIDDSKYQVRRSENGHSIYRLR